MQNPSDAQAQLEQAIGSAATIAGAILSPEFVIGGIIAFLLAGGGVLIGLIAMFDQAREGLQSLSRFASLPVAVVSLACLTIALLPLIADPMMVMAYAASPVPFLVVVALVGVGGEEAFVVFFHLAVAGAGATGVLLVRGVARQRGLTI